MIYIVAGGEHNSSDEFYLKMIYEAEVTIACDSGLRLFEKLDKAPDYLIGDLDSAEPADVDWAEKAGTKIMKYPPEKDDLDLELAIKLSEKISDSEIIISGALGGRIDQSIAAIYLLGYYNQKNITILEENLEISIVKDYKKIKSIKDESWSIIALGKDVKGLTLRGMRYPLENYDLNCLRPLGISNQANGNEIEIEVKEGIVSYIRWIGKKV